MRTDSPLLKFYYQKLPKYQETGQVTPDQKRLQELGSDAYTAMAPFYNTLYEAANKYANPQTGLVSPFNNFRAAAKAFIKHPGVLFMKRHNLPDISSNPYSVEGYSEDLPGTKIRNYMPSQWAEPRKEHHGLGDWWEQVRQRHEENKAERQGRRNSGRTDCWGANCYEELDEAKWGGLHKYQTKGKVINSPIYTDDSKKVKDYNDSLNLYNQGEHFKKLFEQYVNDRNYFANQLSNSNRTQKNIPIPKLNAFDLMQPLNNPNIKPIKTQYVIGEGALGNSKGDPNYQLTENINQKSHVYNDPSMKVGYINANDGRYNLIVGVDKNISPLRTYKKPVQPFVYKKSTPPPPSLSPGISHIDPISTTVNTPSAGIIPRSTPNVQLPSKVDMGKYKVDYFDPGEGTDVNGGWHTKSFMTEQESQDYMKGRPMYGPNMTQRVEYKLGGLHKYQVDGAVTDCPQGFSKNALGMCVNAAGQTPEQAAGAKNILQSVTKKAEVNTKPLATPYVTREQQVTAAVKNAEKENKPGLYNQSFVGPMQFKTIDDERARAEKLQQYVNEHPYAQLNSQGDVERTNWDRDMETGKADKGTPAAAFDRAADALMTGIDAASMITGAGEIAELGIKGLGKIASKVDKALYPTRVYRAELPGGNLIGYAPTEGEAANLAKKIGNKGEWATKDLEESFQYTKGYGLDNSRNGLLTGHDINFTEYKLPFWKKNVLSDADVVKLKKLQGVEINPNEYIIPDKTKLDKFLYPRRTNTLKGIPEDVITNDKFYDRAVIPLGPNSTQFASLPYKYVEDQINAITGHKMPITYDFDVSKGFRQDTPINNWEQPSLPPNSGIGKFKRYKKGGITKYQNGGLDTPETWEKEIRDVEHQIGNPSQWTMPGYIKLQSKLADYKNWRENTPKGRAVVDYHNEPNEYLVPVPEHLKPITKVMMQGFGNGGQYKKGGEYDMSHNDIQKLIKQGYKIQFV